MMHTPHFNFTPEQAYQDKLNKLHAIKVLSTLDLEALKRIEPYFHEVIADKDSSVFHEGDHVADTRGRIFFVVQGSAKLVKYTAEGEGTIVRLVGKGEFFGVSGALTDKAMPFSAEALSTLDLLYVQREDFVHLIEDFPTVALAMMVAMGEMLWFHYETHNQVVKKSDARVCKIILHHLEHDGYEETDEGKQLKLHLPHEYLASMTGIAYEESVRIISRLKKEYDCIHYLRGGTIVVVDENKVREIAQIDQGLV